MPNLTDADIRAIFVAAWVTVCVLFLGLHLDAERTQSIKDRSRIEHNIITNQKAINHKMGVPFTTAEGNVEN